MEVLPIDVPNLPTTAAPRPTDQPVKVRKKPGRKPNPASPALRKAQNRAAQRAFRERKERHMRELECAIKQVREQRDLLQAENEHLRRDNEVLKSENWYLKGIVLSLQLVCFQHHIVIPQHGPHLTKQTLSVLAQSIPEPIGSYLSLNANSQQPETSFIAQGHKRKDRYISTGSIIITQDGVHTYPNPKSSSPGANHHHQQQQQQQQSQHEQQKQPQPQRQASPLSDGDRSSLIPNLPALSPLSENHMHMDECNDFNENVDHFAFTPQPVRLEDPLSSNLAAIQTLRLRLRLQSACVRTQSPQFAIQPTILQLSVPHDPRIDLIPTPHMRDRMILFRDQFDLDDCFRCLLAGSVFHGGDPAIAGNWQLPPEFFEKYWFLTIDYDLRRTTNRWRRMQGLEDLKDFGEEAQAQRQASVASMATTMNDLGSFLNAGFANMQPLGSSSISSQSSATSTTIHPTDTIQPATSLPMTGFPSYPNITNNPADAANTPFDRWETFMMGKEQSLDLGDLVHLDQVMQK
ncbi:hypothetical protein EC973_006573 [Apophysomyces ossiformis]|uniref:BZIP domain-containing protein n=1 Tax=Apophysomyces ossiformis TaxID=679940 RepID=A0A8H7ER06_9FUNG|nr:hypothetical protein EC973_006573 [Apophysomyces ossiformis]